MNRIIIGLMIALCVVVGAGLLGILDSRATDVFLEATRPDFQKIPIGVFGFQNGAGPERLGGEGRGIETPYPALQRAGSARWVPHTGRPRGRTVARVVWRSVGSHAAERYCRSGGRAPTRFNPLAAASSGRLMGRRPRPGIGPAGRGQARV